MKKNTVYRILYKEGCKACSYPNEMSLPRIGETVLFEKDKVYISGQVYDIRHIIADPYLEIKICVK